MSDYNMSCQNMSDLVQALLLELNFGNKLKKMHFKLY